MFTETLFYIFSALIVLAGLWVVLSRNVVNSALFMVVTFIGTAGLFVLLEAYFLALLQVLVYAGAVMVLFLFIIMLINVDRQARMQFDKISFFSSFIIVAIMAVGMGCVLGHPKFKAIVNIPLVPAADYPTTTDLTYA